jgi:[ribosomal protein S5]-alanine N-acetyltransferase
MMKNDGAIYLKKLTPADVTQAYVDWMNDPDVVRYLESRGRVHTLLDVTEYVTTVQRSGTDHMFGIHLMDGRHIGNVKIGHVDAVHKHADIGIIIGDKREWGKGYATEAITQAGVYAFTTLGLHKLWAGVYANNVGSYKAFLKAGYREVGVFSEHRICNGVYVDQYILEKVHHADKNLILSDNRDASVS